MLMDVKAKGRAQKMRVFVIIPAFNEAGRVGKVVQTIPKRIVNATIVVDDGSNDETRSEATAAGALVVSHGRKLGVGAAIKRGYREALMRAADIIIVVAGDGQHDPSEIPKLIAPIVKDEADYVVGDRLSGSSGSAGMPRLRNFGNRLLTSLTRRLTGLPVRDAQCGYAAVSARALQQLNLEFLSDKWGIPNDMLFECSSKGLRVIYVPVKAIYGGRRSYIRLPAYIFRVSTILFRGYVRHQYLYRGLYVFSLTGGLCLTWGVVLGLWILATTLHTRNLPGVGTVILDAVLLLTGMLLLVFGFLSDLMRMMERRIPMGSSQE